MKNGSDFNINNGMESRHIYINLYLYKYAGFFNWTLQSKIVVRNMIASTLKIQYKL
jgi:hypothetical protein